MDWYSIVRDVPRGRYLGPFEFSLLLTGIRWGSLNVLPDCIVGSGRRFTAFPVGYGLSRVAALTAWCRN